MSGPAPPGRARWNAWLAAILVVGAALRIAAIDQPGWERDVHWFRTWAAAGAEHGVTRIGEHVWCDYPPGYLWILRAVGGLHALVHGSVSADAPGFATWVKVPPCLADMAIAWLLAVRIGGSALRRRGLVAAALVALNPAVVYDSAVWGQADSVPCLLALLCLFAALHRRHGWAGAAGALACLVKPQMVILLGPVAVAIAVRDGRRAPLRFVAGALAAAGAACLPHFLDARMDAVTEPYLSSVGRYPMASLNAHNLWWIATAGEGMSTGDGAWILPGLPMRTAGLALFAEAYVLALAHAARCARTAPSRLVVSLPLLLGGVVLAFYGLVTQMHERYVFPALVLLAIPAAVRRPAFALHALLSAATLASLAGTLWLHWPEQAPAWWDAGAWPAASLALAAAFLGALAVAARPWIASSPRTATALAAALVALVAVSAARADRPRPVGALGLVSATQGWGTPGIDRSADGQDLCIDGLPFRRGIGAHAPSELRFPLGGRYSTFQAHVGIQYQANAGTNAASFEVFAADADGVERLVGWSGVLRGVRAPVTLRCDVRGARELVLVTRDGGDGIDRDHTVWADARVEP